MEDNIKITKEEVKIKLEIELLELKKEISNILIPENDKKKEVDEILKILQERKDSVEESLRRIEDKNFWNCENCGEKIEDKRFFADATVRKCIKHMEI